MREVFQQELYEVQVRLVEISELVLQSIRKATEAFNESDVALADQVISADREIDEAALSLDELAIEILYREQPMARDLRIVVSALRMSASLERMGDLAQHIAQLARYRYPDRVVPDSLHGTFLKLGAQDVLIAQMLTELLRTQDVELGDRIRSEDDVVDKLHQSVFDAVLSPDWTGEAGNTVDVTLASRYHERFAD
ncbi:phosphate signaling complex protein PhoU, partial [Gryllotalpicola sp.]|uniref:phosphate signaling complex protein PhoU n=1 Tax=Gryllotalpicola sp. TaxID=1932787 RepID=UPI00260EAA01